jgi:hypothetical protein
MFGLRPLGGRMTEQRLIIQQGGKRIGGFRQRLGGIRHCARRVDTRRRHAERCADDECAVGPNVGYHGTPEVINAGKAGERNGSRAFVNAELYRASFGGERKREYASSGPRERIFTNRAEK